MTCVAPPLQISMCALFAQSDGNLRSAAFEALSEVIEATGSSPASLTVIEAVSQELLMWLERSFTVPFSEEIGQIQGLICGCLNNVADRLGPEHLKKHPALVDIMFKLYVRVIETSLLNSASPATELGGLTVGLTAAGGHPDASLKEDRNKVGSEEDAILAIGTLVRGKHLKTQHTLFDHFCLVLSSA